MSLSLVGLAVGIALGFAGYFGGFGAFVIVAALGLIGCLVGRYLDGDLDPGDLLRPRDRGRDDRSRPR
ncbi:hypothetical protein [Streptomyces candidus]|uniref:Uncharacterized membrane protein YjjP (DUF1212 family) n=1 Tax=Streptomyces candidus TaxID=67283 RepID=A0A7X0HKJ8_9ACTN|nr:hypothetical protein [Streptomyces candidus]MBB6439188.1 uncharacterized membrane protein YjjP (DUF1212 family) [Streptomyces candidus]